MRHQGKLNEMRETCDSSAVQKINIGKRHSEWVREIRKDVNDADKFGNSSKTITLC